MSDNRRAINGEREVPVDADGVSAAAAEHKEWPPAEHKEWVEEMRGWLIVLATLAAGVTYQAGLNPPGGFWQDNKDGHEAGDPVLRHGRFARRYLTFFYCNATAFATSLVIIMLLLNERVYKSEAKVVALTLTTTVDLMSLVGAYIAGSTRDMPSSIYIIVLTCVLFLATIYMTRVLPDLCFIVLFMAPPLFWLAKKGWLPVTGHMRERVKMAKEREKVEEEIQRAGDKVRGRKSRWHCCSCGWPLKYDKEEREHEAA